MQLQANNKKVWQAVRTGNSPTKLATLRQIDKDTWFFQWKCRSVTPLRCKHHNLLLHIRASFLLDTLKWQHFIYRLPVHQPSCWSTYCFSGVCPYICVCVSASPCKKNGKILITNWC